MNKLLELDKLAYGPGWSFVILIIISYNELISSCKRNLVKCYEMLFLKYLTD